MNKMPFTRSIAQAIALLFLFGWQLPAYADGSGMVISATAPLYKAPDSGSTVISRLARGTEVSIEASTDGFVGVQLASGEEGWLPEAKIGIKTQRDGKVCLEVGFEQAIGEGLITASFHGGGGFAGTSVTGDIHLAAELGMTVCPVIRQPFAIVPGAKSPSGRSYQRMMVRSVRAKQIAPRDPGVRLAFDLGTSFSPTGEIQLGGSESDSGTYAFEAYCLDRERATPEPGTALKPDFDFNTPGIDLPADAQDELYLLAVWTSRYEPGNDRFPGLLCLYLDSLEEEKRTALRAALEDESSLDRLENACREHLSSAQVALD